MRSAKARLLCPLLLSFGFAAAGCGGGDDASGEMGGETTTAAAKSTKPEPSGRTDPRPADYVPYRCSQCSCRVFMGDEAICSRPTCQHHWSDHQSKID